MTNLKTNFFRFFFLFHSLSEYRGRISAASRHIALNWDSLTNRKQEHLKKIHENRTQTKASCKVHTKRDDENQSINVTINPLLIIERFNMQD